VVGVIQQCVSSHKRADQWGVDMRQPYPSLLTDVAFRKTEKEAIEAAVEFLLTRNFAPRTLDEET